MNKKNIEKLKIVLDEKFIIVLLISILFLLSQSQSIRIQIASYTTDYYKDVEEWWSAHPFNLGNSDNNSIGSIQSPANTLAYLPLVVSNEIPPLGYFPLGVFEHARATAWCIDHNFSDPASCPQITRDYTAAQLGMYSDDISVMTDNLSAHHLDSIMFYANSVPRDNDWWTTTDSNENNIAFGVNLFDSWFNNPDAILTLDNAKELLSPIVTAVSSHPSIKAYNLTDEPAGDENSITKLQLMTQAVHELDPAGKATAVLIGLDRANAHLKQAGMDIATLDIYPYGANNAKCDTHMSSFGLPQWDFTDYLRYILKDKPANMPLWLILQAHRWTYDGQFALKKPSPAEMRLQTWLAVGEGAQGIFYFIYSPFVTPDPDLIMPGLNAPEMWQNYDEIASLMHRLKAIRPTLLTLRKTITGTVPTDLGGQDPRLIAYDEKFTATVDGGGDVYASTLTDGTSFYVVIVNRNCNAESDTKEIRINSSTLTGTLEDLETNQTYSLGSPITFRAGDGKIFKLIQ